MWQTLHYICVSGSNCNLIFALKSFNVAHSMQLSGKTFHLSTIQHQKRDRPTVQLITGDQLSKSFRQWWPTDPWPNDAVIAMQNVKQSGPTRLQALGSELIPVSWQSARRWHRHKPGAVTFHQARGYFPSPRDHLAWPIPNYTAWWQRHTGVSSLPKTTTQWCPARTWTRRLWIANPLTWQ